MKGILVGAATAIGGVLVGFAFATKADVLAEAKWWDLMTAFGTVGAVVAAVVIPIWQRAHHRRDLDRQEWLAEYSALNATKTLVERFKRIAERDSLFAMGTALESIQRDADAQAALVRGFSGRTLLRHLSSVAEVQSLNLRDWGVNLKWGAGYNPLPNILQESKDISSAWHRWEREVVEHLQRLDIHMPSER